MQLLTLHSEQINCEKTNDGFRWSLPNLDLRCFTFVAISSLCINFTDNSPVKHQYIRISTNLIDTNTWNPNGVIHVITGKSDYSITSGTFENWPLDSGSPREILFTFSQSKAKFVNNFHVTLAFSTLEDAIKTLVSKRIVTKC